MKIDILRIAKLANLTLSEGEKDKLEKQLEEILGYIGKLKEVNAQSITETAQVTGLENVTREDKPILSLSQEEVLQNTKLTNNGYFKVKHES